MCEGTRHGVGRSGRALARTISLAVVASSPAARAAPVVTWPPTAGRPASGAAAALRASLIDHEVPVAEHPAVQLLDRAGRFLRRGHLHEAEPPRAARELVSDDPDRLDGSGLLEELPKVLLRSLVRQVTYEELGGHRSPPASERDKKALGEACLPKGG